MYLCTKRKLGHWDGSFHQFTSSKTRLSSPKPKGSVGLNRLGRSARLPIVDAPPAHKSAGCKRVQRNVGAFASFRHSGICSAACKENNSRQKRTQGWPKPKIPGSASPASSASRFANQDDNLAFASAERPMGIGWVIRFRVALPRRAREESIRAHREGIEPIQPHCLRS